MRSGAIVLHSEMLKAAKIAMTAPSLVALRGFGVTIQSRVESAAASGRNDRYPRLVCCFKFVTFRLSKAGQLDVRLYSVD